MPDLAVTTLRLRPTGSGAAPPWTGQLVSAWLLDALRRVEPELTATLQSSSGLKPYTVSPLTDEPDEALTVRVTSLRADVTAAVLAALPAQTESVIHLSEQLFTVDSVTTETWDYADLLREATLGRRPARRVRLSFVTPTTFRQTKGRLDVPLPLPELVFGSLMDRWQAFATVSLHPDLGDFIHECVALSYHRVRSRMVALGDWGSVAGFVGDTTFTIHSSDSFWRGQVHLLAAFAAVGGVGRRTTLGLGQTRLAEAPVAAKGQPS